MLIKNCLNPKCGKEFEPKNKKGVYCSANCRAAHAYQMKTNKEVSKQYTKMGMGFNLPDDFLECKHIGILQEDGTIDKIFSLGSNGDWVKLKEPPKSMEASLNAMKELGKDLTPSNPKRTFDDLLSEAKTGVVDMEKFKADLNNSKCTPGQKEMILSKIT